MIRTPCCLVLLLVCLCAIAGIPSLAQTMTITRSFENGTKPGAGRYPIASLVLGRDGNFYGTTQNGGSAGYGTVFKITAQGKCAILHSFNDGTVNNDGFAPEAALAAGDDGDLYGTADSGGTAGKGTVFKITPTGVETILHNFGDGTVPDDGTGPNAALIQSSDGDFYGTTSGGGSAKDGTVFKITPSGTFSVLHSFNTPNTRDGFLPSALIQLPDGSFYGTTQGGGETGGGTVFKITPSGGEAVVHSFSENTDDGVDPRSALVLGDDGNLYGTTFRGGIADGGTVFKITPSGTESVIHSFDDPKSYLDLHPDTALARGSDGKLYGTTDASFFTITTQGVLTTLHMFDFRKSVAECAPRGALVRGPDGAFYGTTFSGGLPGIGFGTVFKITPSGTETLLYRFGQGAASDTGGLPNPLILGRDGTLYGTTQRGGTADNGTFFKVAPDGATTVLYDFRGAPKDGSHPQSELVQGRDGSFYGTTSEGGSDGRGTVFKITSRGAETVMYNIPNLYGGAGGDASVSSALIQANDGNFYATTTGGNFDNGTVYKMTPTGTVTILHSFGDGTVPNDGIKPYGALVQGADGDFYGTTTGGGTEKDTFGHPGGTVFKITPTGTVTVLHNFGDGTVPDDGTGPRCTLTRGSDGDFYGTTSNDWGTIFRITPAGAETVFVKSSRVCIDNTMSTNVLVPGSDGNFYAASSELGCGGIYRVTPTGDVTSLYTFYDGRTRADGQDPTGVVFGRNGMLYGTTLRGGSSDAGTVFKFSLPSAQSALSDAFSPAPSIQSR